MPISPGGTRDLLYHATAHFEVSKFVHNAKPEKLKYDRMIEVAKAHEKACKSTRSTSKLTQWHPPSNYSNPLIQTSALSKSFQKGLPRRPVANADAHTTMMNALPTRLHAVSVARRTTGLSNVEALGGGTGHPDAHPPWEGHRSRDHEDSVAISSTKAGDKEEEAIVTSTDPPPINQELDIDEEPSHTKLLPSQLMNSSQDQHTLSK